MSKSLAHAYSKTSIKIQRMLLLNSSSKMSFTTFVGCQAYFQMEGHSYFLVTSVSGAFEEGGIIIFDTGTKEYKFTDLP